MVEAYWEVGRVIVDDEQAGKVKADYGKRVLEGLAQRLTVEFGKGFDQSNLRNMRSFFMSYPIRALRRELSSVVRYALPEGNTQIFASHEAICSSLCTSRLTSAIEVQYDLHLDNQQGLENSSCRNSRLESSRS